MAPELEALKRAMTAIHPELPEAAWAYVAQACRVERFARKRTVLEAGARQRAIGFVAEGLVRGFYVDAQGQEVTVRFVDRGGFVTHYTALIRDLPSRNAYRCLEDSTIVWIPLDRVRSGYDRYPALDRFGRLLAEGILSAQQDRLEDLLFLDAEERYRKIMAEAPDVVKRVSLAHLASYLGLQRPSLSRIRGRMARGGNR